MNKSQFEGSNRCKLGPKWRTFCRNHLWSIIAVVLLSVVAFATSNITDPDYSTLSMIQNFLLNIGGPIACVYIFHSIKICFWRPIKRDWLLSQGVYVWRVIGFVLAVPIALTLIITVVTNSVDAHFQPSDMMYSSDMYGDSRGEGKVDMSDKYGADAHQPSMLWTVFYHFIDPGNQHSTLSLAGRIIAGICATLGVLLLNGLLVSVLVGLFDSKREKWRTGTARYSKYLRKKSLYVIIGGGEIDVQIVRSIFDKVVESPNRSIFKREISYPYILIQTSSNVEDLRANIYSQLNNDSERRHVVIYAGSRTSSNDIAELDLSRAKLLYIFGEIKLEESQESMHDAYNMRCLELVADYLRNNPRPTDDKLRTYLMFEHQTTFSIYQFSEISESVKANLDFRPINFYELWAQRVLINPGITADEVANAKYKPLEGEGINKDSDDFVHLVIFGMSRMGIALAIEAAHLAHYPNFVTKKIRTRITFIDANMEQERNFFMSRFRGMFELARHRYVVASPSAVNIYSNEECGEWVNPTNDMSSDGRRKYAHLGDDFIDIEWEFIDGTIENPVICKYLEDAAKKPNAKLTVAMCHADLNQAVAAAIYLPSTIYDSERLLQVLVYQRYDDALFSQLSHKKYSTPFNHKIVSFGEISKTCSIDWLERRYEMADQIDKIYKYIDSGEDVLVDVVLTGVRDWTTKYNQMLCEVKSNVDKCKEVDCEATYNEFNNHKEFIYGKSQAAKLWSNIYNANSIWTKLRCANIKTCNHTIAEIDINDENIWLIANVEHNRWNVEQLMMTYQPLSYEEYCVWQTEKQRNGGRNVKNIYKAMMKHPNICSSEVLHYADDVFSYDVKFTRHLPRLHRVFMNILR